MDQHMIRATTQVVGVGSSYLMAGIYFGTSAFAINPLLPLPINESTRIFSALYHGGAKVMVPLSFVATGMNIAAAYLTPEARLEFSAAAVAAISTMVYTVGFMLKGIERLLEIQAMDGSRIQGVKRNEVIQLLVTWKDQNFVRAGLSLAAAAVGTVVVLNMLAIKSRKLE